MMMVFAGLFLDTPAKADRTAADTHKSSLSGLPSIVTSILCTGDIMLVGSAKPVIEQRGVDYPFDAMPPIIEAADLAIGNLEMPLGLTGDPIPEKDFTFIGEPKLAGELRTQDLMCLRSRIITWVTTGMMRCWKGWRF